MEVVSPPLTAVGSHEICCKEPSRPYNGQKSLQQPEINVPFTIVNTPSLALQGDTILLWVLILKVKKRLTSRIEAVESSILKPLLDVRNELNEN